MDLGVVMGETGVVLMAGFRFIAVFSFKLQVQLTLHAVFVYPPALGNSDDIPGQYPPSFEFLGTWP